MGLEFKSPSVPREVTSMTRGGTKTTVQIYSTTGKWIPEFKCLTECTSTNCDRGLVQYIKLGCKSKRNVTIKLFTFVYFMWCFFRAVLGSRKSFFREGTARTVRLRPELGPKSFARLTYNCVGVGDRRRLRRRYP